MAKQFKETETHRLFKLDKHKEKYFKNVETKHKLDQEFKEKCHDTYQKLQERQARAQKQIQSISKMDSLNRMATNQNASGSPDQSKDLITDQ